MKTELTDIEKENIVNKLNERIKSIHCPMCHNSHFIIADGYFNHMLQVDLSQIQIGGPNIPSVAIICNHCGYISFHALGALGLLPVNQSNSTASHE
ncbi:MAG: hypothetical protein IIX17_05915 [Tidjanibacter sp.]|nr:hypothetical protein [Tidjanibacter sp.]